MTIRHITRDEYDIANDIKYIAFLKSPAPQKNDADDPDAIYSSIVGYFDDGGTMTARIRNMAYEAFFEGKRVPIGAICAVASSPEARGRGRIRELFQYALKEDYDRGALFSTLFPFSHGYYRNLGYELCAHLQKVRVPIEELRGFAGMPCTAKLHRLSDGFDVIRQIEARMFQPYNPCMLLTDRQYKKALGGDPVLHGDYRYILSDPDGTPCAYVYFTAQSHQGQTLSLIHI